MVTLNIKGAWETTDDLAAALEEAAQRIREGYKQGAGSYGRSAYWYIEGEDEEEELSEIDLDFNVLPSEAPEVQRGLDKHDVDWECVGEHGPGGGNPVVKLIGTTHNIMEYMRDYYDIMEEEAEWFARIVDHPGNKD